LQSVEIADMLGVCVSHTIVFSEVIWDFLSLRGLLLFQPSIYRSITGGSDIFRGAKRTFRIKGIVK
jgi:hypothetical protein